MTIRAALLAVVVSVGMTEGLQVTTPSWNATFPTAREFCVDAGASKRLVFVATPEGTPPAAGWPVYFSFVTDIYPSANGTMCGDSTTYKKALAFSTPADSLAHCPCIKTNTCDSSSSVPAAASAWPPPSGYCDYDALAGLLWDTRLKQLLVANGIAVVQVNPEEDDGWLAYNTTSDGSPTWTTGTDKPFLLKVFHMLKGGAFGKLDANQVALRGWSGGAQMVSWMINLQFMGELSADIRIAAGLFLAGGSHDCYQDTPGASHSQCANCDPSDSCPGMPWHVNAGCSSSPTLGHPPCCSKCCPTNFTEQYFFDHPAEYKKHPPAFLSQLSTQDENADLCACKNYHETLLAQGVRSELVLVKPSYEKCYCIGDPDDPAAAGSPFARYCLHDKMSWSCKTHEMGFAQMVLPSVKFLLSVFV